MSNRVIESTDDGTGKSRQTVQSYQPLWMTHWMRASNNSTADRRDDSARKNKELDDIDEDLMRGLEASRSVKEPSVIETKTETKGLSSKNSLGIMCSSLMKHGEDGDETKEIRPINNHNLELGNSMECKERIQSHPGVEDAMQTSLREYYSVGEDISKNPLKWVKTCVSAKDSSPATSAPFLGSSTQVMSYHGLGKNEFGKGKAVVYPLLSRPSIISNNQFHIGLDTSMNACFREHNKSLLLDAPLPTIRQDWLQKMQNFSVNRGVQLQPLSCSSNSGGQGNVRDIGVGTSKAAIKNESSAETNTMGMDYLKEERPTSVANSTRPIKGFNFDSNFDVASSKETAHPLKSTRLPDINLELPASPGSSENAGPSSSRTQSLEMDVLLAHADHPTPKSNDSDPTTRWVKRLKVTSSDSSGRGTKSTNLAENSSHDKKRAFFRNVLKNSITSSEPTPRKILGKEIMLFDRSQKEEEESNEVLLSHAWIKRWLRNGSQVSEKKPEAIVVCEPQSSKMSADDLQMKQFPSIAAMALMGKAMSGYQTCELKKRGNFTVWNTKAF